MKKINILFSIPNFITAGSGREMFNIIENLSKDFFSITIMVEKEGGNLFEEAKQKGYSIVVNNEINKNQSFLKTFNESLKIAKWIKKYDFDIWQSFHWSGNYQEALISRLANIKYIYVKKNMNWNKKWILKSILSNKIVARNTTLLDTHFNSFLFKNKATLITGGVDLLKFKKLIIDENYYRIKYSISENFKIISCIAQVLPIKNQLLLVKSVAEIENTVLFLAGRPDDKRYYKEIESYVKEHSLQNRVFLLGSVSDTVLLLNCSSIFVLPTNKLYGHQEGCPVALIEAMACGLTCVASNVAGNIDLIKNDSNGYIFKNEDRKDLVDKINLAIKFPKTNENSIEYYNIIRESKDFEKLYKALIN